MVNVVTNEAFEAALADVNNRRIISGVCGKFHGQVPQEELKYRGNLALFHCLRKHDSTKSNRFTTSLYWHTLKQCLHALRDEQRGRETSPLPNDHPAPSLCIDALCVRECVEMLPPTYRQVLVNYFFDGMTLREIGEANGYSHVVASRRLKKAKAEFRRLYRDD